MKKSFTLCLFFSFLFVIDSTAQIVAITGLNADSPDGFSFVALDDIPQTQVLHFTDLHYDDANNEFELAYSATAIVSYTPPTGGLSKGDVVYAEKIDNYTISLTLNGSITNPGTYVISGTDGRFNLAAGGKLIMLLQLLTIVILNIILN